jgi:hypothetical protein
MKKTFVLLCATAGIFTATASADALKNSLTNMMHKKDSTPGMVDLSRLDINGQPPRPKSRSPKAVIATVNGTKVIKKNADAYIKKRTNGQVTDFDLLPKKQRIRLLQEMSISQLASDMAEQELTDQEKTAISTRVWMQKQASKNPVTDAQVREVYDNLKKRAIETKSTKPVPEYDAIKANMKMQMSEKAIVGKLMKDVKITVIDKNMIAGSINGTFISIDDANNALNAVSKGKATWASIPATDKERVLKMIAPGILIEAAAKKDLSSKEIKTASSNYWMQSKVMKTEVSDKELKAAYDKIKKASKKAKAKKKLPEFEQLKNTLHMQIAKEKVIADLMKTAKIKLK